MENPLFWLTFLGPPTLVGSEGREIPLVLRYRKGLALLAWLAAQKGRPQSRRAATELLWPESDESSGRANLRVVVSDLVKRLAVLGFADHFEVRQEWLTFHSRDRLVTDEQVLGDAALRSLFAPAVQQRAGSPWCVLEGLDAEGDFGTWVRAHRLWLGKRSSSPSARVETALTGVADTVADQNPSLQWHRLAILRVALIDERRDERSTHFEQRQQFTMLADALRIYGATLAAVDAEGVSFVFGLHARSGGFFHLALRAALASLELMPAASLGLTAGHLLVSPHEPCLQGRRLLDAAHLARLAQAGEIAVDTGFAELPVVLASRQEVLRLRPAAEAAPVWFYTPKILRGVLAAPLFPATPFCGRQADLDRLSVQLQGPVPVVVVVVGPPGIGKSRLALELSRRSAMPRAVWLFCRAETAQAPWACLIEFLARQDMSAFSDREARAVADLLTRRHVGIEQRGGVLAALARLFAGGLTIVDDAQWMDPATARLLDELVRSLPHRWLLIRRPVEVGWLPFGASRYELTPLDDDAGRSLLASLGQNALAAVEVRTILARARGRPLFLIAEASRTGAPLADALAGWCNLPGVNSDTLGAAALLGQQFCRADLAALTGERATETMLTAAAKEGLIFAYHRDWWGFVHPLLREECRARLERAVEVRFAAQAAERFLLRGETARAAELLELAGAVDQAATAWLTAAQAALRAEDASAACALFEHLARLGYPAGEVGDWARLHHAKALIIRDGYGITQIETLCREVAERHAHATDDARQELGFAAHALLYLWSGGDSVTRGLEQAKRLIALAQTDEQRFAGLWAYANTNFFLGDFASAKEGFELLLHSRLDHAGRTRYFPSDPFAFLATNHAWVLWFFGVAGWREEIEAHVVQTQREPTRQAECIARVFAAAVYLADRDWTAMAVHAQRALEIAQSEAFSFWEAYATMMVLIVRAHQGVPPEAATCAMIEAAVTRGYPAGVNTARWLLAEAWVAARCWSEARALTERTLASALGSEHLYCLPDIYRLHACALSGLGETVAANEVMQQARQLAQSRGLHGWLAHWAQADWAAAA